MEADARAGFLSAAAVAASVNRPVEPESLSLLPSMLIFAGVRNIVKTGCDYNNADLIVHVLTDECTEDDVRDPDEPPAEPW